MSRNSFDSAYYRRFYLDQGTRVTSRAETVVRGQMLAGLLKYIELPVRAILDAGCGLGWMRQPLLRAFPDAKYTGLEVSEHLCQRHGWTHASVETYRTRARFDVIVCYDVLQYLTDAQCARAINNLARLCRGAMLLHVPTREDWQSNADHSCSDNDVHLRATAWYRTRLARHFRHAGFGLYVRRNVPLLQWELERSGQ